MPTKKQLDEQVKARESGEAVQPPESSPPTPPHEAPSSSELKKADANLPVYDEEKRLPGDEKLPDTPSGVALKKVGNLDGEDVEPGHEDDARLHGEAYQAEKHKVRWGH
jgi:hypothetical protein